MISSGQVINWPTRVAGKKSDNNFKGASDDYKGAATYHEKAAELRDQEAGRLAADHPATSHKYDEAGRLYNTAGDERITAGGLSDS